MKLTPLQGILLGLWALFTLAAVFLAGGSHQDSGTLLMQLISDMGRSDPVSNPVALAFFSLMGIWPLVLGLLVAQDSRGSWKTKVLFTGLSMVGGAFVLVPWLIVRNRDLPARPREFPGWLTWVGGAVLAALGAVTLRPVLDSGAWDTFVPLWESSAFLRTMTWDLALFVVAALGLGWELLKVGHAHPLTDGDS